MKYQQVMQLVTSRLREYIATRAVSYSHKAKYLLPSLLLQRDRIAEGGKILQGVLKYCNSSCNIPLPGHIYIYIYIYIRVIILCKTVYLTALALLKWSMA